MLPVVAEHETEKVTVTTELVGTVACCDGPPATVQFVATPESVTV